MGGWGPHVQIRKLNVLVPRPNWPACWPLHPIVNGGDMGAGCISLFGRRCVGVRGREARQRLLRSVDMAGRDASQRASATAPGARPALTHGRH